MPASGSGGGGEAVTPAVTNDPVNPAILDKLPEFPGGLAGFGKYVQKNYRVPEVDSDISGNVLVSFVVERDGSLTDIKVVRDLGYGTGKEAIRMLKSAPKWKPGIQNGKAVRVAYNLPIRLVIKSN